MDKYDEVRREKWHKFINVWSTENFKRHIYTEPDEAMAKDKFLQGLEEHKNDDEYHKNLQLVRKTFVLRFRKLTSLQAGNILLHDFTQDYNKTVEVA